MFKDGDPQISVLLYNKITGPILRDTFFTIIWIIIIICLFRSKRAKQTFIVTKEGIPTFFRINTVSPKFESDAVDEKPESMADATPPPITPREDKPVSPPPGDKPHVPPSCGDIITPQNVQAIIRCPYCEQRLRVPAGRDLFITCDNCKNSFEIKS